MTNVEPARAAPAGQPDGKKDFKDLLVGLWRRRETASTSAGSGLPYQPVLWRIGREDIRPLLLIGLLPVLIALPQLLGWLHADPLLYTAWMAKHYVGGVLPGVPYIDPNNGFTSQALGYRAALDWIHGEAPWWNPYSGVGLPLAAEYQPAAFFPLTLLLLLPQGVVWRHLLLQALAGWGTYGLLRQLGLKRTAAVAGGLLYAFNGTLAWFDHAPAMPVPFLPWMLWGIERAHVKAGLGLRGGWRLFAIALAMSLLAGFPETAYLGGLLALAWALLRGAQTPAGKRIAYVGRVTLGGMIGIALSAPQIVAFVGFLPDAWLGAHTGEFAHVALSPLAAVTSLAAPYEYGPPFGLSVPGLPLSILFGGIGGYISPLIVLLASYGVFVRRSALAAMLLAWSVLVLAKSFGVEPFVSLWNLVPGIPEAAFHRYAPPTWELALVILAARCIDELPANRPNPSALLASVSVGVVTVEAVALIYGYLHPHFPESAGLRYSATAAALWAMLTTAACLSLLIGSRAAWRPAVLAVLLVLDSMLLYATPTLSNPRGGTIDESAIGFLRGHLGLQRFYSLGPIQPNYSAYFGIGSINHNYLPVPRRWIDWVRAHLDSNADPTIFNGNADRSAGRPTQAQELRRNFEAYESIGVKYVIAAASNPFVEALASQTDQSGNRPLLLQPGQTATGTLQPTLVTRRVVVSGLGVLVGNGGNTANGTLELTLCGGTDCASGSRSLSQSRDNAFFDIALARPIEIAANTPIRYTFVYRGGSAPVALWAYPTRGPAQAQNLKGPAGPLEGFGLQINLQLPSALADRVKLAYADEIMSIYELPDPKPYFEVVGALCSLDASERTRVVADCQAPATLIRRELFFPGWTAALNGKDATLQEHAGLFQAVALPAGKSDVRFHYAPRFIGWAWLAVTLALAALFARSRIAAMLAFRARNALTHDATDSVA